MKQLHLLLVTAFVTFVTFAACAGVASAQQPPDQAIAEIDSLGAHVRIWICQGNDNCYPTFTLYRNPPGFNQYQTFTVNDATIMFILTDQQPVKVGQSYTYKVCTGGPADSTWSNCKQTNTVTDIPPPPPPPPSTHAPANTNNTLCWWTPPKSMSVSGLIISQLRLAWTNPPPGQCSNPDHVAVYRVNATAGWDKLAQLKGTIIYNGLLDNPPEASTYSLPSRYTDSGLQPHTYYQYMVCEGDYVGQEGGRPMFPLGENCMFSKPTLTGGASPILTAERVNPTTVRLLMYVDNDPGISSISVTREGSDDPCRQGGTLGNGLQGCQTIKVVNGVPQSTANIITVYNWTAGIQPSWTETSKTPGYQITFPNDTTVKPGVEYYYLAHVVPNGDSTVVTVPSAYTTARSQQMVGGVTQPVKGGAPPPLPQSQPLSLGAVILPKLAQPTNLKAVRSNNTSVTLSWTTTGAAGDTAHLYLMSATAASTPAATFGSAEWNKGATLSRSAPQQYTLPMKPAPSGQKNYYMVCAASSNDKATLCSSAVAETGLPFAPAPAMPH